jgi:hypothetical protein
MKSLLVMSSLCVSLFVQAQVAGLNAQSANTPINSTIEKVEPGLYGLTI